MTAAELASLALKQLGVIGANEAADANDQAEALAAYARYYAELQERALATWEYDVVPARIEQPLSIVLAVRLSPMFFTGARTFAQQQQEEQRAERGLLRIIHRPHIGGETEIEVY